MVSSVISRLVILVFGTLYPAYASYKAVKSKDVREYVKWMMYWIVFAFFTAFETVSDIFVSWFPFYYEIKILFIIWLLSPATRGSSIIYRKFVHPRLMRHEKDIDKYIEHAKENGYTALVRVGRQGFNVATDTLVRTALTSQTSLVQTMRRYSSMQDLNRPAQQNDGLDGDALGMDPSESYRPRDRASWHPAGDNRQFDPATEYEILQRQYVSQNSQPRTMRRNEIEFREQDLLYRQSSRLSDDMNPIAEYGSGDEQMSSSMNHALSESDLLDSSIHDDNDLIHPRVTTSDYQSSTLPRVSKSRSGHRTNPAMTTAKTSRTAIDTTTTLISPRRSSISSSLSSRYVPSSTTLRRSSLDRTSMSYVKPWNGSLY